MTLSLFVFIPKCYTDHSKLLLITHCLFLSFRCQADFSLHLVTTLHSSLAQLVFTHLVTATVMLDMYALSIYCLVNCLPICAINIAINIILSQILMANIAHLAALLYLTFSLSLMLWAQKHYHSLSRDCFFQMLVSILHLAHINVLPLATALTTHHYLKPAQKKTPCHHHLAHQIPLQNASHVLVKKPVFFWTKNLPVMNRAWIYLKLWTMDTRAFLLIQTLVCFSKPHFAIWGSLLIILSHRNSKRHHTN